MIFKRKVFCMFPLSVFQLADSLHIPYFVFLCCAIKDLLAQSPKTPSARLLSCVRPQAIGWRQWLRRSLPSPGARNARRWSIGSSSVAQALWPGPLPATDGVGFYRHEQTIFLYNYMYINNSFEIYTKKGFVRYTFYGYNFRGVSAFTWHATASLLKSSSHEIEMRPQAN
jgi:hypothetical protein